ncbi:MAG: hypothetical protein ACRDYA_18825 [Egibacteraceae bacterium]
MYATIPSEVLMSPVAAHLEDATRLLRESIPSNQLPSLHTIIGDLGVLLGYLSFNGERPAQARAYLSAAEDHATEANDPELLARVLVAMGWTYSNVTTGGQREPSQEALTRLQRADRLTKQVSPMLKTLVTAHLAEEQAVAKKPYGSDEAFARSREAFAIAEQAEPARHHPCAVADYHSLSNGEALDGYQGVRELLLGRGEQAIDTLASALERTRAPRRQAVILADLGDALSQRGEPDEACARLGRAHTICSAHDYPLGAQRIVGVRERFPERFAGLDCVRELDERLRMR